ncbi:MAG: pilin [Patescibacteria group bacterium]
MKKKIEFGIWNLEFGKKISSLILYSLFSILFVVLTPTTHAATVSCAAAGKQMGITTACTSSCDSGSLNITNLTLGSKTYDATALCPGGQDCCGTPGPALCENFGTQMNLASSECRSVCLSNESALNIQGNTNICGQAQSCCVPGQVTLNADALGTMIAGANPSSSPTSAGTKSSSGGAQALPDPLGGVDFPTLIGTVIRTFIGIAGSIALLMFVYGGIRYIISGGKESEVAAAKTILINAAIGIVLIFMAYLFTSTIINAILAS